MSIYRHPTNRRKADRGSAFPTRWRFIFVPCVLRASRNTFNQELVGVRGDRTVCRQIGIGNVTA